MRPASTHSNKQMPKTNTQDENTSVRTAKNNSDETMAAQFNNLTKALNTLATGSNNHLNPNQQQSLQTQLDTITKKLDSIVTPKSKT